MAEGRTAAARPHFRCFDGLRALAVTAVLVHHVAIITGSDRRPPWATFYDHLDIGMAVFFLISGFLLYRPFVSAHLQGREAPRLGPYLRRRALRILPAYWVALTVTVLHYGAPSSVRGFWDWVVFYGLGQIYLARHLFGGITQAWSLCVEVTFYLLLPVYAHALRKLARSGGGRPLRAVRVESAGIVVLYATSVVFRAWELAGSPLGGESLRWLPANLDYFALGMGLAVASARMATKSPGENRGSLTRALGSAPAAWWGLAAALWLSTTRPGLPRNRAYGAAMSLELQFLYGLVGFLLLVPAVFGPQRRGRIRGFLASAPVTAVGRLSYGVYLWHIFALFAWQELTGFEFFKGRMAVLLVAGAAGSILLAMASWVVVERPAMMLGRYLDKRRLLSQQSRERRADQGPPDPFDSLDSFDSAGELDDLDRQRAPGSLVLDRLTGLVAE